MSPKTAVTAAAAGLALIVAVFAATVVVSGSRPSHCGSCHVMAAAVGGAGAKAHAHIACYSCHAPSLLDQVTAKVDELVRMYPAMLSREPTLGASVRVPSAACRSCHMQVGEAIIENDGLRIDHSACATGSDCGDCHLRQVHGDRVRWMRGPSMQECTACHVSEAASLECDTCHQGRRPDERLATGPWQVTHGTNWEQTHGMGDLRSCATCHHQDYCVRCHGIELPHPADFAGGHGRVAEGAGIGSCYSCHDAGEFCFDCHGIEMPHPKRFVPGHAILVETEGDGSCLACHERAACETCHDQHVHPGNASGLAREAQEAAGER